MTLPVFDHLERCEYHISELAQELNNAPEKADIIDLINAAESIDLHYQEMCKEYDDDDELPAGTTYEEGVSIEFYIEADWWHNVSVALRKLRQE